ncbi:LysR family substrate-binding domain-containing protein [Terracoccus luteus]|uniref:LysR substrate-binding domain-containing protein n=1 Tax=Terracoccus luteus TaxID=53356 RepID=A0A839PTT0_9MICO|nr:LysR family substrate-binding domain-containing protein [Terracoccus luteus]MBB2987668.1 hypothetical protein [Terracoccus luteus]MCP2173319.1 hypothetical protein [Terracoccus luteus]
MSEPAPPFEVRFVEGVTPDKWLRIWAGRHPDSPVQALPDDDPLPALRDGSVSMAFVRLPVDRDGLHVIPLYDEVPVVVAPRDHPIAAFDTVAVADLAGESLLQPPSQVPEWREVADDDRISAAAAVEPMTVRQAVATVAAGVGILVLPMSVARVHHRKDVVSRPVDGVAPSSVGLAWRVDDEDPRVEAFIGVVRGRTERSSRGGDASAPTRQDTRASDAATRHPRPSARGASGSAGRQGGGRTGGTRGGTPGRKGTNGTKGGGSGRRGRR